MEYKIAVLITTFLRDKLLYKTIQSIVDNYTKDCIILIADQGYNDEEKNITIDYYKSQIPLEYFQLPFDCGLSAARNYLIRIANERNIPYILMGADSIQFKQSYNFNPIINFLESNDKIGLVGFDLENSKCKWEYFMEVTPKGIQFLESDILVNYNEYIFKKVDICRNIFLVKTPTVLNLYDEELKLGEHELAFLEYKKRGYEVYWTDKIGFVKCNNQSTGEYQEYRKRLGDYLKIVKQKLGITGWVIYPPERKNKCK